MPRTAVKLTRAVVRPMLWPQPPAVRRRPTQVVSDKIVPPIYLGSSVARPVGAVGLSRGPVVVIESANIRPRRAAVVRRVQWTRRSPAEEVCRESR